MKKVTVLSLLLLFISVVSSSAHCQIPCGIYNDSNIVEKLHTDLATIKKASAKIKELSKDPSSNAHQLTRWITNKESHAQAIQDTITQYFLAQRLKTSEAESNSELYLKKLTLFHQIIVTAMKCKQSTEPANIEALTTQLSDLKKHYATQE